MKFSDCTKKIAFFLLITASISYGAEPENQVNGTPSFEEISTDLPSEVLALSPEEFNELKANLAKVMDELITKTTYQTGLIESILEDLSQAINNNVIGGDNKAVLLKQIRSLRTIINSVKNEAFVDVDPYTLQYLITFNEILIEHIAESISEGFHNLPPLEKRLVLLQKRAASMDLSTIEERLEENQDKLVKLAVSAEQIGLNWFNKQFRKLNKWLHFAHRRKWDRNLFIGSIVGFIATHWISLNTHIGYSDIDEAEEEIDRASISVRRDHSESRKERALSIYGKLMDLSNKYGADLNLNPNNIWVTAKSAITQIRNAAIENPDKNICMTTRVLRWFRRNWWGYQPIIDREMKTIVNNERVGMLAKFDFHVRGIASTFSNWYVPILAILNGPNWSKDFGKWFGKTINSMWGRMLGGLPAQLAKKAKQEEGKTPKYTFDDVVGLDHIKEILSRILEYIKNPERFDRANIPPERGYLFTGLPGTGKSFVAEAFGGEIRKVFKELGRNEDELGFYSFDADFINERGIELILNLAKKESPCVIFIDEIDLLRLQRGGGNNSVLLGEFLSSMSGVLSKEDGKQVILLAATNRPEHLDKALRRRGRFGKIIHFELPTVTERKSFFMKKLTPLLPDLTKIDIDKLAQETEGRTYEELTAMTNAAFQKAKITGEALTQQHLESSLDEEINNIINKKMHISEKEQELIAAHQAGHALAIKLLNPRRKLAAVTIKPITTNLKDESAHVQYHGDRKQKDVQYGKTFTRCSFDHLEMYTHDEKILECKIILAGMVSERILLGSCGHSYHANDKEDALNVIKTLVFEGLNIKEMPKQIQLQYFQQALALLQQCEEDIETLFRDHENALRIIAERLKQYKTLSAKKIKEILIETGYVAKEEISQQAVAA